MPGLRAFVNLRSGPQEPIDQSDLNQGNQPNNQPNKVFSQAQTALSGLREPELHLQCTQCQDVTVAQDTSLNAFAIQVHQRLREGLDQESFSGTEIKRQMLIPDALLVALQII